MTEDAILGVCIAVVLSVMMICICVSSCYHSKYYYSNKDDEYDFDNTTTWKTTTYTIPTENLDKEEYIKLLEILLSGIEKGNFVNVRIGNNEVTANSLKDLLKEMNSTDTINKDT